MLKVSKKLFLFVGIFFIILMSSSIQGLAVTTNSMTDKLGTDFSNNFGLVIDLNSNGGPSTTDLGANVQVLQDLGNSSNPVVNPVDQNPLNDQQFFLSHFKVDNVDNIYLALNKLEYNISLSILGKNFNIGHVNGSSPFQSLVQFFKYGGNDVLVANTFRGLIAYSTNADNGTIDSTSNTYFGYSFVEQHLLKFLSDALVLKGYPGIPQYNFEPIYYPSNHTFGMIYRNYFVVWQSTTPSAPSGLSSYAGNTFNSIATGGDSMVGASLFDYLKFTYQVVEDPQLSNSTYKVVNVIANYDLGPMKWLITRDSSSAYNTIESNDNAINSSNSFSIGGQQVPLLTINPSIGPSIQVNINVPSLSFYTGEAVSQRLNAQAMKNSGVSGMGIAVASSTNAYVVSHSLTSSYSITDSQNSTIPLSYGGNTFYNTNFQGKSTYTRTFTNGTAESGLPVYISVRSFADMSSLLNIASLLSTYFDIQSALTYGLTVFSARQLDPTTFATSDSNSLNLNVQQTSYVTLVEMPKWSGLQVTQDPTFSAVAAVASNNNSSTIHSSVPGFEFAMVIATVIPLYVYKKRLNKK